MKGIIKKTLNLLVSLTLLITMSGINVFAVTQYSLSYDASGYFTDPATTYHNPGATTNTALGDSSAHDGAEHRFFGWTKNKNETIISSNSQYDRYVFGGDFYFPGDPITINDNTLLYAVWIKDGDIQYIDITYYTNNSSGAAPVVQTVVKGRTATIRNNMFTPDLGYKFDTWNTVANGSGTTYNPGTSYLARYNLSLYAQWVPNYDVTKTLTYQVRHQVVGEATPRDTDTVTQQVWINAPNTLVVNSINVKNYPGYVYQNNLTIPQTVTTGAVLTALYDKDPNQKKDLHYTVEHYIVGEVTPRDTVPMTVQIWINDTTYNVTSVAQKTYVGYKFDYYNPTIPTTVTEGAVLKVYYDKDPDQKKDLHYTVEHYIVGEVTPRDTVPMTVQIWINDTTYNVTTVAQKTYVGYKFDHYDPTIPTTVSEGAVLKVYYDKDPDQKKDLNYTVEHYIVGEVTPRDTVPMTVQIWVNDTTYDLTTVAQKTYVGYKFSYQDTPLPSTISEGAVIKVYYDEDPDQTKDLTYSVAHYIVGEGTPRNVIKTTVKVWVNDTTYPVTSVARRSYPGYSFSYYGTALPTNVAEGSILRVYYSANPIDTKELSYTIEHYVGTETTPRDSDEITVIIPITDDSYPVDQVNLKSYTGFKFDRYEPTLPVEVKQDGVIKVFYTAIPIIIDPDPTPLDPGAAWALINLLCTILSVALAVALFIKKKEDEEAKNQEEIESTNRRIRNMKIVAVVLAVAAIIIFIFTEDMTLPMTMVDKWTILMAVIAVGSVITTWLGYRRTDKDDQQGSEQQLSSNH